MAKKFEFQSVEFMSVTDKQRTLNAWIRFLKSGLKQDAFTKALYHHLMQHCGHIAHYNIHGFYDAQFGTPERAARFLRDWEYPNLGYAGGSWGPMAEYRDLNAAMVEVAQPFLPRIREQLTRVARKRDQSQATALLSKLGIPLPSELKQE